MPLSREAQNYLDDMAAQPGARQPATVGEIWDSEWKRTGLDTITGVGKPLLDATDKLRKAIEGHSQRSLEDYAAQMRIPLTGATYDQRIKALNDLADTLPEEAKTQIAPLRDVRRNAATEAQKIERDAADVSSATYGLAGTATAWAAGVARQTTDPVNMALMVATAPIGGPITPGITGAGRFIAGQALAGAASQAAVEPYIQPARAELGLESGVGRAAGNIFEAGVGGAVLAGAGVGIHRLFRAAADSYRAFQPAEAPAQPQPANAMGGVPDSTVAPSVAPRTGDDVFGAITAGQRHPNLTAEDFAAAALHAERDAVTEAPPGADPVAHAEAVAQARQAVEGGGPMPRSEAEAALGRLTPEPRPVAELPPAKPIEPKGPPAAVKDEPDIIGDPVLAREVDTRLAAMPDADRQLFHIEQPDGTVKAAPAKTLMQEIADDAKAVKELIDCIGQEPK